MCWHSPETPCTLRGGCGHSQVVKPPLNLIGDVGLLLPGLSQEGKQPQLLGEKPIVTSARKGGTRGVEGDDTCGVWYLLRDVGKASWDCAKIPVGH